MTFLVYLFILFFTFFFFRIFFFFFFFFFQAEDGIRDGHVTGVQTCALPISFFVPSRQVSSVTPNRSSIVSDRRKPGVIATAETPYGRNSAAMFRANPLRASFTA